MELWRNGVKARGMGRAAGSEKRKNHAAALARTVQQDGRLRRGELCSKVVGCVSEVAPQSKRPTPERRCRFTLQSNHLRRSGQSLQGIQLRDTYERLSTVKPMKRSAFFHSNFSSSSSVKPHEVRRSNSKVGSHIGKSEPNITRSTP
jgi:hypothetical protein